MIKSFRSIALLEGLSLLALLFFAMPMKYIAGDPIYVKNIGMAHGILFILYVAFAILIKNEQKWNVKTFAIVCLASVVPFGTFYIEKKYFYSNDRELHNSYFFNSFLEENRILYLNLVKSTENKSIFKLDQSFENIYVDFATEDELIQKVKSIKLIPYFDIYNGGKNHKYKFTIEFENGLKALQAKLKKEYPKLKTKLKLLKTLL